jgi:hypothetical protein
MRKKGREAHGEQLPQSVLTKAQVVEIRELYQGNVRQGAVGPTQQQLADEFGVKREAIGKIIRGERWVRALPASAKV